jgi:uncharacterized membrane protein (DUF485 family)
MPQPDSDLQLRRKISRANRLRFGCAGIVWFFYFGYVFAFDGLTELFADSVTSGSVVTWAIVYFYFLIILSLAVEYIYMKLRSVDEARDS